MSNCFQYELLDKESLINLYNNVTAKFISINLSDNVKNKKLKLKLLSIIESILYAIENEREYDDYKSLIEENLLNLIKSCIECLEKQPSMRQEQVDLEFVNLFFDFVCVSLNLLVNRMYKDLIFFFF